MSTTALVITIGYAVVVVIGAAIAFAIWRSTTQPLPDGDGRPHVWGKRESGWLVAVVVIMFSLLMATIFYIPYGAKAGTDAQAVNVVGAQFGWAISPAEVVSGRQVKFNITSKDVNHGFGLYGPVDEKSGNAGPLLTQIQVVPGVISTLVWTFHKPGVYYVRCLEFCGAGHHDMDETTGGRITVKAA